MNQAAKRVGRVAKTIDKMTDAELKQLKDNVCPCCLLDTRIQPYGLCEDLIDLGEMGAGYVAFFKLIKLLIFLCFLFALANIYKIIANSKGTNCFDTSSELYQAVKSQPTVCGRDWVTLHSIANYGFKIDYIDKGIVLGYFFVFLLVLIFYYPNFSTLGERIDKKSDLPSDWTVQVVSYDQIKDVTSEVTEADLRNYFNGSDTLPGTIGGRVEKINTSYNLEEYEKKKAAFDTLSAKLRAQRIGEARAIHKKLERIETKLLHQITIESPKNEKPEFKADKYKTADDGGKTPTEDNKAAPQRSTTVENFKNNPVSKEFHDLVEETKKAKEELGRVQTAIKKDPQFSNNIYYMTFTTKKLHDEILLRFASNDGVFSRLLRGTGKHTVQNPNTGKPFSFRMKQAPEPTDILWKNLSATLCQKIKSRIITFLLTFVLIAIGFGIVLGLKVLQREMGKDLKPSDSALDLASLRFRALAAAISFVIFCVNTILPMVMRALTQYEKHTSNTDFFESLTFKIAFVS